MTQLANLSHCLPYTSVLEVVTFLLPVTKYLKKKDLKEGKICPIVQGTVYQEEEVLLTLLPGR